MDMPKGYIPWNKGKKNCFSKETLKKISDALKGKNHPCYGKKHSTATILKMRNIKLGKKNPFYGKKHTCEMTSKMSADRAKKYTGDKHWNWKGGITERIWGLRHTNKAKIWRTAVFERDNYTCQKCGSKDRKLLRV
ncbi:hypothetical protein LCGC14_1429710, partial [marine sediment metagenome]